MISTTPLSLSLTFVALALAPSTLAQANNIENAARISPTIQKPACVRPTLVMSDTLRALVLNGEPGSPYVVFAGLEQISATLTAGVQMLVTPDAVLSFGELDSCGRAFVHVDNYGSGQAGGQVYAQALLWSQSCRTWLLPNQATNAATIELHGPQTTGPQVPFGPGEQLHLINAAGTSTARATIGVQNMIQPRYFVELEVEPPDCGYELQIDSVKHRGSFTRVSATLLPPNPGQPIPDRIRPLRQKAFLGVWIGTIEVDLRLGTRPQSWEVAPVTAL